MTKYFWGNRRKKVLQSIHYANKWQNWYLLLGAWWNDKETHYRKGQASWVSCRIQLPRTWKAYHHCSLLWWGKHDRGSRLHKRNHVRWHYRWATISFKYEPETRGCLQSIPKVSVFWENFSEECVEHFVALYRYYLKIFLQCSLYL